MLCEFGPGSERRLERLENIVKLALENKGLEVICLVRRLSYTLLGLDGGFGMVFWTFCIMDF